MIAIINPGTGAVGESHEDHALANIEAFVKEAFPDGGVTFKRAVDHPDLLAGGRYAFFFEGHGHDVGVDMPGIPLERVRYVKGLNAWDFPRLYVDGSSWLWEFAISAAQRALGGER